MKLNRSPYVTHQQQLCHGMQLAGIQIELFRIKTECERLKREVEEMNERRMHIILRHGEALMLLEKFSESRVVRWFCAKLHREAVIKICER